MAAEPGAAAGTVSCTGPPAAPVSAQEAPATSMPVITSVMRAATPALERTASVPAASASPSGPSPSGMSSVRTFGSRVTRNGAKIPSTCVITVDCMSACTFSMSVEATATLLAPVPGESSEPQTRTTGCAASAAT